MSPKKFLKRYLPNQTELEKSRYLRPLNRLIHPDVWHLNRRSVAGGVWVGLFFACIPFPIQMFFAAFFAVLTRVNLPVAVVCTWISNPLTWYPIFYFTYRVGCSLIGIDGQCSLGKPDWTILYTMPSNIILPLMLGSFISGSILATIGYIIVRLCWRLYIMQIWEKRKGNKKRS